MTITISPTKNVRLVNGQMVREWSGMSAKGVPVRALIAFVGAAEGYDHCEFEAELLNTPDQMESEPLTVASLQEVLRKSKYDMQ